MSPGERVAQVAHELLDPGPMSHVVRREVYRSFIDANFDDSVTQPVFASKGTNCAIFVRGCLTQAGILPRGRRPKKPAITTWLGVKGFVEDDPDTKDLIEGSWIPLDELEELHPGDVLFWTGYAWQTRREQWYPTTNGHVEIVLFDGDGWMWTTAGGGGASHMCKMSAGPKDVRTSHLRPLRGVWRPELMVAPIGVEPPAPFVALRRGDHGPRVGELQLRLLKLGYTELGGVDSDFGKDTRAAVQRFQTEHHIEPTGIVDRRTWQAIETSTEPGGIPAVNGDGQ